MNPNQQPNQMLANSNYNQVPNGSPSQQGGQFTQQHHDAYNQVRNMLHGMIASGVPGMSNVLGALDKSHSSLLGNVAQAGMNVLNAPGQAAKNTMNPFQQYPGLSQNPIINAAQRTGNLAGNTLGNPNFVANAGLQALLMAALGGVGAGEGGKVPSSIGNTVSRWSAGDPWTDPSPYPIGAMNTGMQAAQQIPSAIANMLGSMPATVSTPLSQMNIPPVF